MALPAIYADESPLDLDKDWYTEDEYFALDSRSSDRLEFLPGGPPNPNGPRQGRVRAMSGGSPKHSALAMRLGRRLGNALESAGSQTCEVYGSDLKVRTADERITLPDVSVVCGALSFYPGRRDTVTNPIFVAEVLSPSTEDDDRNEKRVSYQTLPTLQHYLLVSADRTRVEVFTRDGEGWRTETYSGRQDIIPLPALGVALAMAELYKPADFEQEED